MERVRWAAGLSGICAGGTRTPSKHCQLQSRADKVKRDDFQHMRPKSWSSDDDLLGELPSDIPAGIGGHEGS